MRCNVGVLPSVLADQHLIAEYRELLMVPGQLKKNEWRIKSARPEKFCLGTGHMNWFKTRFIYLLSRHTIIIREMVNRGFKCDLLRIELDGVPTEYLNDWVPTMHDSLIVRERISQRLRLKPHFYKFKRQPILNMDEFISSLMNSELSIP